MKMEESGNARKKGVASAIAYTCHSLRGIVRGLRFSKHYVGRALDAVMQNPTGGEMGDGLKPLLYDQQQEIEYARKPKKPSARSLDASYSSLQKRNA
jgi:hypothetical protein